MKRITLTGLLAIGILMAMGQDVLTTEKSVAQKGNKLILLNFSGSDWCIPCINMQQHFFESPAFKQLSDSLLLTVRADFPRKKKNLPSKELVARNEKLADRFNPAGNFPYTVLLNADMKVLQTWDGLPEEGLEKFCQTIRQNYAKQYQ
ncbi:MAG: thioredoxin family protein [Chitinophagaceae bacterium]|nr:MAG: thioredoxin family protein [Chitinophagaceae bacterium]